MEKNAFFIIFALNQTFSWSHERLWGEGGVPSDINGVENTYEILVGKPKGNISLTV